MLKFEFRKIDDDTAAQLIELSRMWADEGCCWGIVANSADDLREPLAVALDGEKIVGYIFGHYYDQAHKSSYAPEGAKCFAVDELYVLPNYRSQGIGKQLFRMMEREVQYNCSCITLATSTRNYQAILKLYIEELGMYFNSAFLVKQMRCAEREESICE